MPQRPTSEELAALREELSSVDRALLEVVARRSRCVAEIAAFKAREDVPALAAGPRGWAAGLAFIAAAALGDARFPAPADPGGGAAIVVRPR